MISIIKQALKSKSEWLRQTFDMCHRIKENRENSDYGFEWAIQTAIGDYLISKKDNYDEIRVNQPLNGKGSSIIKPDIFICKKGAKTILELKTVRDGDLSYTKNNDLKKPFPEDAEIYFLIVSYPPFDGDWGNLNGTTRVAVSEITGGFKWALFKKQ